MELEKNTLVDLFLIPLAGGVHPKFWQKKTRKPSGHKNNKTFAKSMEEHRTQLSDCRISLECPLRVLSPFGTHHSPVFPPTKKRPVHDFPPDSPRFQARLIIKKSRFLARLGPCDTLDDAKDFRSMRVARWKDQITRWWFQTFFIFTPIPGEMIQFEKNIFQLGWNHQLE